MKQFFFYLPLLCFLLTAGCSVDFDYTGQSFAPRPHSAPVTFFESRQEIPAEGYRIIGRGTLTVSPKTGGFDRRGELRERAREYGADAVCIVDKTVNNTGIFPESRHEFSPPYAPRTKELKLSTENTPWQEETLKREAAFSAPRKRVKLQTRFLFLKKSADLEKEQKQKNPLL